MADTEGLESKAAGLTAELTGINTQIAALIQQNASTPQDQEAYNLKYNELTGRYGKVQKKLLSVQEEAGRREAKARALDAFERELLETESMNIFSALSALTPWWKGWLCSRTGRCPFGLCAGGRLWFEHSAL